MNVTRNLKGKKTNKKKTKQTFAEKQIPQDKNI